MLDVRIADTIHLAPFFPTRTIVPRRTIFLRLGMVLDAILSFATFVEQSRRNGTKKTAERKQLLLLGLLISSSFVLKGSENMHFKYRIYSINRPGRLLNFWTLRVGAYSRWALIKFSPFSASVVVYFATKQ